MFRVTRSNIDHFKYISVAVLVVCCLIFLVASRNWPLVNDAVLIRYATFLLDRGFAPYKQIFDLNLPGSYLVDWTVKHTFGETAFAWRLFDLGLLAIISSAIFSLARFQSRFAGLYAGLFFVLFHARNGIAQLGQRDLTVTAFLLAGTGIILSHDKPPNIIQHVSFGVLVGLSTIIKPQAILFLPIGLLPYFKSFRVRPLISIPYGTILQRLCLLALSALLPIIGALFWLIEKHSFFEFWRVAACFIPIHAKLGRHSFFYLLGRCLTASHATILILAAVLALTAKADQPLSRKQLQIRIVIIYGMGFSLLYYMVQLKAYPYHRYPFVAFLSLFVAIEFTRALASSGIRQIMAISGIGFGIILSIFYANHALHDRWRLTQVDSLANDLNRLGGVTLDDNIQCIDTIDGCLSALYRLHITQSTGMLYDEFLFVPRGVATQKEYDVISGVKEDFLGHMFVNPPRVIVMTPWLFPDGPDNYAKIKLWPEFDSFIAHCYRMDIERQIVGERSDHPGYRIYVREPTCA
jgi:hypothetical protein